MRLPVIGATIATTQRIQVARREPGAQSSATEVRFAMTMNFTDPSELRLSGQNPYMMVYDDPAASAPSTLVSIWHVQYCPDAGPGNVLFIRSQDLTDGVCRVFSDRNVAKGVAGISGS